MDNGRRAWFAAEVIHTFVKRLIDILGAVSALVLSTPLMALIALAIWVNMGHPIIYRGTRAGRGGSKFQMFKFRTMAVDAEATGGPSTAIDDPRVSRLGRFLRGRKLDELPQLLNVLVGEMSLVGPRPQVLFYTERYTDTERRILSVKPGITDLATLYFSDMDNFLGSGNIDRKYATEVEPIKNRLRLRYVESRSILLDLRILIETLFLLVGIKNVTGLDLNIE